MINIDRTTTPPPASLSSQTEYRSDDVLDALYTLFLKKCYLTEQQFSFRNDMQIDHFIPHQNRNDLKFSWSNLYPAHQRANLLKSNSNPIGGYLDPCHPDDDVETDIMYSVDVGGSVLIHPRDASNVRAVNTAALLNKVHLELNEPIRLKHHAVVHAVARWRTAQLVLDRQKQAEAELELRLLLSRKGSFTMLMRSIDVVELLPAEFFD